MPGFDPISEDFLGNPLEYGNGLGQSYDDFTLPEATAGVALGDRVSQLAVEALYRATSLARVSQVAVEALVVNPHARVSQLAVEVLTVNPHARVSQIAAEVLSSPASRARVSQTAIEVLLAPRSGGLVSQLAVELLVLNPILGNRVSQLAAEILTENTSPAESLEGAILSQAALEALRQLDSPTAELSQVTLEVLRPLGKDLYVWWRF